jgi:NADH-quinone oxidoreductase subunit K
MTVLTLTDYLLFTTILFGLGVIGIFMNRKNILVILMCIELILLAVNTNCLAFSRYWQDCTGQILVFFILVVAAIKTAIGLVILMLLYKKSHTIAIDKMNILQG